MARAHWGSWLFAVAVAALGLGCDEKPSAEPAAAAAEPQAAKPKAELGGACSSNEDCGDGLGCAKDGSCQTYKTIECRGRDQACKFEGRCSGSDKGCVAATAEDCKQSNVCQNEGRCSPQEGKCAALSAEDCKQLCAKEGRCSVEEGKCLAASNGDCKQSEACQKFEKCKAKGGVCVGKD